jgi:putative flippase GtrA
MSLYELVKKIILGHFQIVRYIISGGTAAFVNILFLYIFTDIFGWWYLMSAVVAFLFGFAVSFGMQKFWTFRDHSTDNVHVQASIYLIVCIANLLWNTFLMYMFVDIFGMWYILAQIFAGGIVALSSFFIYRKFVFKKPA